MNACVTHFDARLLELSLNGEGNVTLHLEDNEPGKLRVTGADASVNQETRTIQLKLKGPTHLTIER